MARQMAVGLGARAGAAAGAVSGEAPLVELTEAEAEVWAITHITLTTRLSSPTISPGCPLGSLGQSSRTLRWVRWSGCCRTPPHCTRAARGRRGDLQEAAVEGWEEEETAGAGAVN